MNILVCAATKIELEPLRQALKGAGIIGHSFSYLVTGIGNYETLYTLTKYFEQKEAPDLLINFGIAGYMGDFNKGDIYQILKALQPHTNKEYLLAPHIRNIPQTQIHCHDQPLKTAPSKQGETQNTLVDMESVSVCWIAQKYQISKILFKIPYDRVGEETQNFSKAECQELLSTTNWDEVVRNIKELLIKTEKRG